MQEASVAIGGQGAEPIGYAIGNLTRPSPNSKGSSASSTARSLAVRQLFSNGAEDALEALRGRQGELANLIRSSNAVFQDHRGRRDTETRSALPRLPDLPRPVKTHPGRLRSFSLTPTRCAPARPGRRTALADAIAFGELAPEAKSSSKARPRWRRPAPTGFPALRKLFRDDFPPLLRALDPFLRNLNPILTGLGLYKHECHVLLRQPRRSDQCGTHGNQCAGQKIHFLRALGPINPRIGFELSKPACTQSQQRL